MKTGKLTNVGVGRLDGVIRTLTTRDKIVQRINLARTERDRDSAILELLEYDRENNVEQ